MKYLFFLWGLSTSLSAQKHLASREYKSPDSATGGFQVMCFQLKARGRLILMDSTAIWKESNKSGALYEWKTDTLSTGTWEFKNDSIFCKFKAATSFIDSAFVSSEFKTRGLRLIRNTIIFPEKVDTLFIQNIPCLSNRKRITSNE